METWLLCVKRAWRGDGPTHKSAPSAARWNLAACRMTLVALNLSSQAASALVKACKEVCHGSGAYLHH